MPVKRERYTTAKYYDVPVAIAPKVEPEPTVKRRPGRPRKSAEPVPETGINASKKIKVKVGKLGLGFTELVVRAGTPNKALAEALDRFLRTARDNGTERDKELLRAVKAGGTRELHRLYEGRTTGTPIVRAPVPSTAPLLFPALSKWLDNPMTGRTGRPLSADTQRTHREAVAALRRFVMPPDAETHAIPNTRRDELPQLLRDYLAHCEATQKNFPYQHARQAVRLFLFKTEDPESPLYIKTMKVPNMHSDRKTERDSSLGPRGIRKIMARMEANGDGHLAQHVWNLAATSCRQSEYTRGMVHFRPDENCVFIDGVKSNSAQRFVPFLPGMQAAPNILLARNAVRHGTVARGVQTEYTLNTLRRAFNKACKGKYKLNDLRSTGLAWWADAGIGKRGELYHGHSMKGIHQRYYTKGNSAVWSKWRRDIQRDARRMARWLEKRLRVKGEG